MMNLKVSFAIFFAGVLFNATSIALAHDNVSHNPPAQAVVPEAEKQKAQAMLADGPKQTSGIERITTVGMISLDGEFESSDGLNLRTRVLVINPGGIVAVHEHNGRPGVAYILEGEMTEHRASEPSPIVKKVGDAAFEKTGVVHWWKNTGNTPAKALVVDIIGAQYTKK